jgi:hypothetical protein
MGVGINYISEGKRRGVNDCKCMGEFGRLTNCIVSTGGDGYNGCDGEVICSEKQDAWQRRGVGKVAGHEEAKQF